jgi:hypothetical protein
VVFTPLNGGLCLVLHGAAEGALGVANVAREHAARKTLASSALQADADQALLGLFLFFFFFPIPVQLTTANRCRQLDWNRDQQS